MGELDEGLMTEQEVAAILHVSREVLRKWRRLKEPPLFLRMGRSIRYERCDIVKFVRQSKVKI